MAKWTKRQQAAHRRKWVKALRSGEYKQGKNMLRNGDKFCCLGVACNISGVGRWNGSYYVDAGGFSSSTKLTSDVADWLGLASRHGEYFDSRRNLTNLIAKNDGDGGQRPLSFKQIANIIEREPEGLIQQ